MLMAEMAGRVDMQGTERVGMEGSMLAGGRHSQKTHTINLQSDY